MAMETAERADDAVTSAPDASPRRFGLRERHLKVLGLLVIVMAVEAAGIYLLIPAPAASATGAESEAGSSTPAAELSDTVEVPIDPPFNVTNSRAAPGSIIHITFRLVAVVSGRQQTAFADAVNVIHSARVRQAIVKVARSSSMEDLSDPELSTLKRLIREEINKVLRKSYVIEVVISDFKTMEQ